MVEIDKRRARELEVFTLNDYNTYRNATLPIIENLAKKKVAGTYDKNKGAKAFVLVADTGRRNYVKEYGGIGGKVPMAEKELIAKNLLNSYSSEINERAKAIKKLKTKKREEDKKLKSIFRSYDRKKTVRKKK